ncbi:MAG: DUF1549 and DUF1553 domain-containing protein [bacterium]|nr:DUF1549 and DUF1553 domain-containing protein [bacterium]
MSRPTRHTAGALVALLIIAPLTSQEGADRASAHWAFTAPVAATPPTTQNTNWPRSAIDRFVQAALEADGLQPNPAADRRTLVRRLSLDLTGLPPSRDEVRAFLADDSEDAYERLVDRLLASPHYGEHMARYWLDLVRFSDTNGIHHDHYREQSPYRDWVIRAFRDNLPYDEFVTDQIAGDVHPKPTKDQLIASGFHRLHLIIDVGTALPEESLARNVIDRTTAFGTAFLGLTVGCAVCHDHKYDPITQRDFFALSAFFNNLDGAPETGRRGTGDFRRGLQPPYVEFPDAGQKAELERLETELDAANAQVKWLTTKAKGAGGAEQQRFDERRQSAQARVKQLRKQRDAIRVAVPAAMVMRERAAMRPAHILRRGDYANPGERVERATPAFLPKLTRGDGPPTRLHLARWLLAPDHPLTARVAVNRFWQQLFGRGLVLTAEDFGTQGSDPSHPRLLDHLALTFIDSGWDVKALMKALVMSATYRQSSHATPAAYAADPDNRRLARGSRFRLDAEVVRDQVLAASGVLVREMFGRSVKPPQPAGLWKAVALPDSLPRIFRADTGDQILRRSIYTFWKRGLPPPQLTILDAPTREFCVARRERTNTPLQALLLLNETEYLRAARHLARAILRNAASSERERAEHLFETVTSQLPNSEELHVLQRTLADLREHYANRSELANEMVRGLELDADETKVELAAWTALASTVFNLDITKTRQ